eukprot:2211125-Amphidinium_carterae.1
MSKFFFGLEWAPEFGPITPCACSKLVSCLPVSNNNKNDNNNNTNNFKGMGAHILFEHNTPALITLMWLNRNVLKSSQTSKLDSK